MAKERADRLSAKHRALMCDESFPMMRRMFDAVVHPTVSYGCKVWAPTCSLALAPQLRGHARHPAFLLPHFLSTPQERHALHHSQGVCRKALTGQLVVHGAWLSCAGCRFCLRAACIWYVLRDNIADARQPFMCANWAAGVDKQFRDLGMGSPFISSGIGALDSLGFMSRSAKRRE